MSKFGQVEKSSREELDRLINESVLTPRQIASRTGWSYTYVKKLMSASTKTVSNKSLDSVEISSSETEFDLAEAEIAVTEEIKPDVIEEPTVSPSASRVYPNALSSIQITMREDEISIVQAKLELSALLEGLRTMGIDTISLNLVISKPSTDRM